MKILMIPNVNEIERCVDIAEKLNVGFEYNDFFFPKILDDKGELVRRLNIYQGANDYNTIHGVFFDICFNSADPLIREISYKRARQTFEIAKKLDCKKIVFHTNYIIGFKKPFYINNWIEENAKAYKEFLKEYPDIEIVIENMFDEDDYMILELLKKVNDKRFRMCLDVAHAYLSNKDIKDWFNECRDYISHIHINDNNKDFDAHLAIGKGSIDYKYVISELNKLKDVTVLIELNDVDDFVKSYKYLKEGGLEVC